MKKIIGKCKKWLVSSWLFFKRYGVYFLPSLFVAFMAIGMLVVPQYLLEMLAFFCFFLSACLSYLAWRFLVVKAKVEAIVQQIRGQVIIHGMRDMDDFDLDDEFDDGVDKKPIIN